MKRLQRINPQPDTHSLSVLSLSHIHTKSVQKHDRSHDGTGILFQEPNPTGSRPRDPSELCKQHTKPHRPNTQDRARPKRHKGCFRKPRNMCDHIGKSVAKFLVSTLDRGRLRRREKWKRPITHRRTQKAQGNRREGWMESLTVARDSGHSSARIYG